MQRFRVTLRILNNQWNDYLKNTPPEPFGKYFMDSVRKTQRPWPNHYPNVEKIEDNQQAYKVLVDLAFAA